MTVKAWLEGDRLDLAALADLLTTGDVRVLRDGNDERYYLTAPEIDNPPEPHNFKVPAHRLVDRLNGLARTRDARYRPVALSGHYTDDEGNVTVCPSAAVMELRPATFSAIGVVTSPDGTRVPMPPSPWPARFALAATDADVAEVLEIMGRTEPLDWVALYKVHEIIKTAVKPDEIADRGWTDKHTESAFTGSANRADVSGAAARHARNSGGPPKRTMQLKEARVFVSDLVAKWLGSLSGN